MPEKNQNSINPLKRKIELCIRKTGFDENFIAACKLHLDKYLLQKDPSKIKSREEYVNVLMSNLFIDKIDLFPAKRFKSQINECTAFPVPLLPSEVFSENSIPVETRKSVFYHCLRVGDYLDCRVTSSLPSSAEYLLRVIHKFSVTRILDDLNIIVTMRKADIVDLPQVLKEFELCQLVRVVVIEKETEENEIKVYVSVKDNKTDIRSFRPLLGAIPDTLVPKYVLDPYHSDRSSSYKDYLTSKRGFYDPVLLNGIYEGFGIGPRRTYSYFPVNESFSSIDAKAMLRESKLNDVNDYVKIALRELENANYVSSLIAINLSLDCYPKAEKVSKKDKVELSKLYETRGTIETVKKANGKKPRVSMEGLEDWLKGFNLDPTNKSARVNLAKDMSRIANKFYRKKNYNSAAEYASKALKMDDKNIEAHTLMEYLKKAHSEATADWDGETLLTLLKKKKAIGSELKKLSGEASAPTGPHSFDSTSLPSSSTCVSSDIHFKMK